MVITLFVSNSTIVNIQCKQSGNQFWSTFLFFSFVFLSFHKTLPLPTFKLNKNIFKYEKLGSYLCVQILFVSNILINFYKHFTRGLNQHDVIKTNFLKKEK